MGDFSKDINSKFTDDWIKAILNISYTANFFRHDMEKSMAPFGISPQQYNVLRILRGAKKAITINSVKERMIEKTPNTTRLMDKLCAKNLIQRSRSESDRRTVFVEITNTGLELIDEIKIEERDLKFKHKITKEEAFELNRILDKLR